MAESKNKRNTFTEVPCIIGIDQSNTRSGIAIAVNGKLKKVSSVKFKGVKTPSGKRIELARVLNLAIDSCLKKYEPDQIIVFVERIRTFTGTADLRPGVIKSQAALVGRIVDTAWERGIKVYSVDTRCWKSAVLGSSQPIFEPIEGVKNPQKFGSVRKVIELGFKESLMIYSCKTNSYTLDDDAADAACIALYGFTGYPYHLLLET